jgi:chaperonin GroES
MATKKKPPKKPKPKAPAVKAPAAKTPAAKTPKTHPSKAGLRPLGDRILVKRLEAEDVVRGGIIIPDSAKEKPQEGIVVALGEGRRTKSGKLLPFDVKVGDRVMIEKYTGSDVTLEGDEYTIIKEDGVLAVIG